MSETAFEAAVRCHRGQMYGSQPYISHLAAVAAVLMDFGFASDSDVVAAGWLHDVLEDTAHTPDILTQRPVVGATVWACTGVGPSRKDRVRDIASKIADHPSAAIVKLADRIANVEQSLPGSRHHWMYVRENASFERTIRPHVPPAAWDRLTAAFAAKQEAVYEAAN